MKRDQQQSTDSTPCGTKIHWQAGQLACLTCSTVLLCEPAVALPPGLRLLPRSRPVLQLLLLLAAAVEHPQKLHQPC